MQPKDSLKEKASAVKALLGTAAELAQKRALLAKIDSVSLPKLYHAIGKRICSMRQIPPDLTEDVEAIKKLEAKKSTVISDQQGDGETGFAAKAKELAARASKAASDAATSVQIQAAFVTLGRQAVAKYGRKAMPNDLAAEFDALMSQRDSLASAIAHLEQQKGHGYFTVRRTAIAGALVCLICVLVAARATTKAIFGPTRTAVPGTHRKEVTGNRNEPSSQSPNGPSAGADVHGTDAVGTASADGRQALEKELAVARGSWKEKAQEQVAPIKTHYLLSQPDVQREADSWADVAASQDASLRREYEDAEAVVNATIDSAVKKFRDGLTSTKRASAEVSAITKQVQSTCDEQYQRLRKSREAAGAVVRDYWQEILAERRALEEVLEKRFREKIAEWRDDLSAKAAVGSPEEFSRLPALKNASAWKAAQENALNGYKQQIIAAAHAQERECNELARFFAQRLTKKGQADEVVKQGTAELDGKLGRQAADLKKKQAEAATGLLAAHQRLSAAEGRAQQAMEVESERQKKVSGRHFSGPPSLTDDALIEAIRLAPDITDLGLEASNLLTDKCMDAIAGIQDLRKLVLPHKCGVTTEGLRKLRGRKLQKLVVPEDVIDTPEGFEIFVSLTGDPRLINPHQSVPQYASSNETDCWELYSFRIGDKALASLQGAKGIERVGTPENASDDGLGALADMPDLHTLHVHLNGNITNRGIASLRKCPRLKRLVLVDDRKTRSVSGYQGYANKSGSSVDADGIRALKGMDLWELELPPHMRTEEYFEPFIEALTLESGKGPDNTGRTRHTVVITPHGERAGDLMSWPCAPKVFQGMAGKQGIRFVRIEECDCSDELLGSVCKIPDLQTLQLVEIPATGSGLAGLKRASQIDAVSVRSCRQFGDAGVKAIAECENLRDLGVIECPLVTDAGALSLGRLSTAGKLTGVVFEKTGMTAVGKVKLENMLPKTKVRVVE